MADESAFLAVRRLGAGGGAGGAEHDVPAFEDIGMGGGGGGAGPSTAARPPNGGGGAGGGGGGAATLALICANDCLRLGLVLSAPPR